jgi:hypothetical protein
VNTKHASDLDESGRSSIVRKRFLSVGLLHQPAIDFPFLICHFSLAILAAQSEAALNHDHLSLEMKNEKWKMENLLG